MLLEIEVENLQNTLTEVSKMRQYSVCLFGKRFFDIQALSCLPRIRTRIGGFFDFFHDFYLYVSITQVKKNLISSMEFFTLIASLHNLIHNVLIHNNVSRRNNDRRKN